jgi:hypothetical protein
MIANMSPRLQIVLFINFAYYNQNIFIAYKVYKICG